MSNIIIKGYVEVVLKDRDGNIVAREEGKNTVVEMSNNILMDLIYPRLGTAGSGVAADDRDEGTNMTNNTTFPTGANYIGPINDDSTHTQTLANVNQIAYISVGDNVGADSGNTAHLIGDQNSDVASPALQNDMVDSGHTHTNTAPAVVYTRIIDSVTFPTAKSIKFTTTFGTDEGNLSDGIAEIGLWTAGNNVDVNGFINSTQPASTTNMRLFARKYLTNTITKTDDGTLDINYTLTFSA